MSWHYLQGQEEACWEASFLDGAPNVLLKLIPTQENACCRDKETECLNDSQFGITSKLLMEDHGKERLTLLQEDSLAKTLVFQGKEKESQGNDQDCGSNLQESLAKSNQDTHLLKTPQCLSRKGLKSSSKTLPNWGMMQNGELLELPTQVFYTKGKESGYWPTPLASDHKMRGPNSKQKCLPEKMRELMGTTNALGQKCLLNPNWTEWLMGFPVGWTDLNVLEMHKFQQWLSLHFKS